MTRWIAAVCIALPVAARAQSAPPATDIYLAPLAVTGTTVSIGTPVNVTHRPGYDNQPAFTPDGRAILFTSIHDDGQADIYRYDLASKRITRVTNTPESEYSPTPMPGGRRFSAVRVERDSTQRLWSFAMDGTDPRLVLTGLKPVGYHAWIDPDHLALFVLGRPNALVRADPRTGEADTLARNIGRSVAAMPGGGFSYVQLSGGRGGGTATLIGMGSHDADTLVALPRGAQDIVWLTRDVVLASAGARIYRWTRGAAAWDVAADLAPRGMSDLSRMAVSPDGRWLAVVAMPAARQ